ncbi:MAG: hypothetical protein JNM72_21715 [Deltaproteobacteria bacterium]|nr:hypothetical protein [Deltaproteobacteria bacterium]
MRRALLLLPLLSLACRSDGKGAVEEALDGFNASADLDGDGFLADEDCNDQDGEINGGADEVCDGVDNDCDGQIDEGVTEAWFADADGDGFGDDAAPGEGCAPPTAAATVGGDCDDADPEVFPAAPERCDGVDQDCDGVIDEDLTAVWYADADGDGFGDPLSTTDDCDPEAGWVPEAGDCDDADASTAPGAEELCDERDNDCDGEVDEGVSTTWYADRDGDSWGTLAETVEACAPPAGYADRTGDCADDDAAVSPSAAEVCDGQDNDCDGDIDEDGLLSWYADGDGDGYGAGASTLACEAPLGAVSTDGDCDDVVFAINPGASEVCDGDDNDCDGAVDDADPSLDLRTATAWSIDGDGDGYGAGAATRACDAPLGGVARDGDCDDSAADVNPGADEVCNSIDDDCDGLADDADPSLDLGTATTWVTDADGDGWGASGGAATSSCSAPSGTASRRGDCDDGDRLVNPSAAETCDGYDDDCDGAADEGGACGCAVVADPADPLHVYQLCSDPLSWTAARDACRASGYELVTINDAAENTFVDGQADARSTSRWWTGFNDISTEGSWVWVSGQASSYAPWGSGEPNNSGGGEDCGQINRFHPALTWNDEPCSTPYPYICEAGD